jgi:UPF0755 protein
MRSDIRRALFVFLGTMGAGVVILVAILGSIWSYPNRAAGRAKGPVSIEVPRGVTAQEVATLLEEAELIKNPLFFRMYTAQRGSASRIRPGRYQIQAPITPKALVDQLVRGVADKLVLVTLPPGKNFVEYAEILEGAGIVKKSEFIAQAVNPNFIRSLDVSSPSLDGYLFPDTYRLRPKSTAAEVAEILVRRHQAVFDEIVKANPEGVERLRRTLGFEDRHIVTLASIVEKETGRPEERPRIAQLYLNRLIKPDFIPRLLQADPTIIYGCTVAPMSLGHASEACQKFKNNNIQTIHLKDADNEYNTYRNEGLPPGPISNPGRSALNAVLKPDGTPYLYFVAFNDGSGSHYFSTTLAEHEAAVVKYQRGGRAMPGRSSR